MNASGSNKCNRSEGSGIRERLLSGRVVVALILTMVLGLTLGFARHEKMTGLSPERFFVMKTDWRNCADVVLAGASRVYRGLSPEEIESHLPGLRVLNYGFSAIGYSDSYLRAVENVLRNDGRRKIIVLDISPWGLTEGSVVDNGFMDYMGRSNKKKMMIRCFSPTLFFFRPVEYRVGKRGIRVLLGRDKNAEHYFQDFRTDGYAPSYRVPEHPKEAAMRGVTRSYQGVGPVSERLVDGLINTVADWTQKGIEVYALTIPTYPEMDELEDRLGRFDRALFIERFETAGGTWLYIEREGYHTYDGSHLHRDSALKLSREIGRRIAQPSYTTLKETAVSETSTALRTDGIPVSDEI